MGDAILRALAGRDDATTRALAREVKAPHREVAREISRLRAAGLVAMLIDVSAPHASRVRLTERGRDRTRLLGLVP